ncbi:hypothetical protein RIF29_09881 [Crotalaria pallida]|uniref:Uncharacterized protein n=1 Tax=Crotalaria pallida TaxID=3830 RepID=A0AAN9FYG9_CROPI
MMHCKLSAVELNAPGAFTSVAQAGEQLESIWVGEGHFVAPTFLKDGPATNALILLLGCSIANANLVVSGECVKFSWLVNEYVNYNEANRHDEAARIILLYLVDACLLPNKKFTIVRVHNL